jgi:hypothetical protein
MKRREKSDPIAIPYCTLHPDRINLYSMLEWPDGHARFGSSHDISKEDNNNRGKLSYTAKKKLEKAVLYLNATSKERTGMLNQEQRHVRYKVTFITLTLSSEQIHATNTITKECLNQFFVEAKKKWNLKRYVWKAEFQRNGNLHYHILTDMFVPHWELKQVWNRLQNKLGYIDRYAASTGKRQPNSTDIHSIRKVKNISKYVMKYMSKGIGSCHEQVKASEIGHVMRQMKDRRCLTNECKAWIKSNRENYRIWGCSHELSNIKGAQEILERELAEEVKILQSDATVKRFVGDYHEVIYIDFDKLYYKKCFNLHRIMTAYLKEFESS